MRVVEVERAATEYNGWSNRETWVVNLWLSNTEEYYYEMRYIIAHFGTVDEQVEELERYVRFLAETDESSSMTSNLLSTALGRVDWYEIIEGNQE